MTTDTNRARTRAEAVAVIARSLKPSATGKHALEAMREGRRWSAGEWSSMCREALAQVRGGQA